MPFVVVKIVSTGYRFVSYYRGWAGVRRKGRPTVVVAATRGPVIVGATVVLLAHRDRRARDGPPCSIARAR